MNKKVPVQEKGGLFLGQLGNLGNHFWTRRVKFFVSMCQLPVGASVAVLDDSLYFLSKFLDQVTSFGSFQLKGEKRKRKTSYLIGTHFC